MKGILITIILTSCINLKITKKDIWGEITDRNVLLREAIKERNKNEVIKLIKDGVDVNFKDFWKWTPLMYACWENYPEIAKLLVENGALVDHKDRENETLLMYFCSSHFYGKKEAVKILIDLGAEINCEDEDGDSPLSLAITYGKDEIIDLLIKRGADINYVNKKGWNILHEACMHDCKKVIELILEKEADVLDKLENLNSLCLLMKKENEDEEWRNDEKWHYRKVLMKN